MIYEGALTESFKEIIRNELYDTGALYESMQIYSEEIPGEIQVMISCNDYIIYHIARLDLLTRLVKLPEFLEMAKKYYIETIKRYLILKIDTGSGNIDEGIPNIRVFITPV